MSRDPFECPVLDPVSELGAFRVRVISVGATENCT